MIISAIRAGIAYAAGEGAAKTVEHLQGISKNIIEEHAESALISLIDLIVVGVISMAGLFFNVEKPFFVQAVHIDRIISFLNRILPCGKNRLPGRTDQAYRDLNQRGVIGERREW